MIRFVDLTAAYWTHHDHGGPCCAFLNTTTDTFVEGELGYVFDSLAEVQAISDIRIPDVGERCAALVPDGFFEKRVASDDEPRVTFEASHGSIVADGACVDYVTIAHGLTEAEAERLAAALNLVVAGKPDPAIAELTADNERLRALLAGDMPRFKSIVFPDPNNAIAMQFTPNWMLQLLAHTFGELVGTAPNYVESVEMQSEDPEKGRLVLTIQRTTGRSPHEKRVEAEQRATALQAKLDAALAFADPAARHLLMAALLPATLEAYLSTHGWTHMPSPLLVVIHEWRIDGAETYVGVPLRVDFHDYAARVYSAIGAIATAEKRSPLAVYLDMLGAT